MSPGSHTDLLAPREGYIPADGAEFYSLEIGEGPSSIILHGGADFRVRLV